MELSELRNKRKPPRNEHTLWLLSRARVDLYLVHDEANCQEVMLIAAAVRVLL